MEQGQGAVAQADDIDKGDWRTLTDLDLFGCVNAGDFWLSALLSVYSVWRAGCWAAISHYLSRMELSAT
eukprot:COSAG01_NODE_5094_length_4491_cov_4.165301_5_plen_69_part_00